MVASYWLQKRRREEGGRGEGEKGGGGEGQLPQTSCDIPYVTIYDRSHTGASSHHCPLLPHIYKVLGPHYCPQLGYSLVRWFGGIGLPH